MRVASSSKEQGMGCFCLMDAEFQLGKIKFWRWLVVVVA